MARKKRVDIEVVALPAGFDPSDLVHPDEMDEAGRLTLDAEPRATAARYHPRSRTVTITLRSGATYIFPVDRCQGLAGQRDADLAKIEVAGPGVGLRWPRLDEDFSVVALLAGRFGNPRWMEELSAAAAVLGRKGGHARTPAKVAAVRKNVAKASATRTLKTAAASRANGIKGGRPRKDKVSLTKTKRSGRSTS